MSAFIDVKIIPLLGQQNRNWVLMKIFTDEGIVGLGEWSPDRSKTQFEQVKRGLIGNDPMNINKLHYDMLWRNAGTWRRG